MIKWKQFSISIFYCPLCERKRLFVKLDDNEILVRCVSCKGSSITLSLVSVLFHISSDLGSKDVYELSSRGPLFKYLEEKSKKLTYSEYFLDISPGSYKNGIQCQDVQSLTYADESFDICTSTEVFEHVPNDAKGFSEIYRVLKKKGVFLFTVPIAINNKTVERAKLISDGDIHHLLSPEYHGDPIRNHRPILAFRNYGYDILDRLISVGFKRAEIRIPDHSMAWDYVRPVIVAFRDIDSNNRVNSDPLVLRYAS